MVLLTTAGSAQFYTGSQQQFGKNRVQYKGFQWRYHNYQEFKTYYYAGGENLAVYAARSAHRHLEELQKLFDFYLDDKIEILVFNRQSDYKQSNIGLTNEVTSNVGGVTRLVGSKLFIYYEGDHPSFEAQIRSGIAEVLVNKMMYGENWRKAFTSSALLSLPDWYVDGFVAFMGEGWNTEIDSKVKDGILSNRYSQFNDLQGLDARYAGHSLWNYISERYGEKVIPQIFYMARISRNVESGFLFVLGINLSTLANEYIAYYRDRYNNDSKNQQDIVGEPLPIKPKKRAVYTQFKVSPNGRYAAYVTNQLGQYKVFIYDVSQGKNKRIFKRDYKLDRVTDFSYPVLNWHPTQNALAYFVEDKGQLALHLYTVDDGKTTKIPVREMEKVLDFAYNSTGTTIVFSGVNRGTTDLYTLKMAGQSKTQLTRDLYDDLNPRFVDDDHIIFSSNRFTDTLVDGVITEQVKPFSNDYDVFIYDLKAPKRKQVLQRITDTRDADELNPSKYGKGSYTFVSDQNGIFNRYVAKYDSAIAFIDTAIHYRYFSKLYPLTNYKTNVLQYDMQPARNKASFMAFEQGKFNMYQVATDQDELMLESDLKMTQYKFSKSGLGVETGDVIEKETIKIEADEDTEVDVSHYRFGNDDPEFEEEVKALDEKFNNKKEEAKIANDVAEEEEAEFEMPSYVLYENNFAIDELVSQFDNNFLFQSYQRYAGPGAVYFNPGFNALIKVGISDLFENHKVMGGFRIPVNFNSGEYLLTYDNLAGRLDHKFVLYRNSFQAVDDFFSLVKVITHEGRYRANYPLDEIQSLRFTAGYRNDRTITQAIEPISLETPDAYNHTLTGKLEYVFDAVRPKGLNLYNGTRFKVFGEVFKELNGDRPNIFIVGADFRHYQKIHKDIIWASRLAGSYSFGDQKNRVLSRWG